MFLYAATLGKLLYLHTELVQGAAINTCPPSAVRRCAAGRELQGPLRVLRTVCAVCFSHMASPLFTQRSNQLEHVRVVETTWVPTKEVRARLQETEISTRQCNTISGVKELLQSPWCSLQFLILVGLQDHLQKVKLFHQPGLWTALSLVFLQIRPILY